MPNFINLIGKKFGRLVVISRIPNRKSAAWWNCKCSCGNERQVSSRALGRQHEPTKSCGCLSKHHMKKLGNARKRHGKSGSRLYLIWRGMKDRCQRKNNKSYPRYGGRGIGVCQRWDNSFEVFAADIGERPSPLHSIDRINNDGNYEPGNCRWATRKEQANNRSRRMAPMDIPGISMGMLSMGS